MVEWLKKAPTGVVVSIIAVVGLLMVVTIGGFVWLTAIGADTAEFRMFINTLLNSVGLPLAGIGAIGGISAARSASKVEERTNGGLDALVDSKVDAKVQRIMGEQSNGEQQR